MKPPVERVKVSKRAKDILIKVKRNTGLQHWNEICRIALCRSLVDKKNPPSRNSSKDSNIEMDWRTFAGCYGRELNVLLRMRASVEHVDMSDENMANYFRDHLERGIFLLNNIKNIENLI